jgi:hypothetical protein
VRYKIATWLWGVNLLKALVPKSFELRTLILYSPEWLKDDLNVQES